MLRLLPRLRRSGFLCLRGGRHVVLVWLVVRLVWWLVAAQAAQYPSPAAQRFALRDAAGRAFVHTPVQLLDMWTRQDAALYAEIARDGYAPGPPSTLCAFFPLLPLMIAATAQCSHLPPWAAGLVLGNLCDCLGLIMLWRYLVLRLDARRASAAVWAFMAFPSRNFGFSGYTEGPYLLCIATALWASLRCGRALGGRSLAAALLAVAAAAALRPPGALLGLSLGVHYLRLGAWRRALALTTAALGPLVAFMMFLQQRTGDALAFVHVQGQWHRHICWPWTIFLSDGKGPDHLGMWCGLIGAALLWRQRAPLVERLFVTLSLGMPMLTGNVMSMLRFVGVLVPIFAAPFARGLPPRAARWGYGLLAVGLSVGFAISVGQGRRVM